MYNCIQHSEFGSPSAMDGTSSLVLNVLGANSFSFNTATGALRDYNGGVLSLTKTGTGTQTLIGTQVSYSGATTLNNGTLALRTPPPLRVP
ncbi:MAG: autotransporter-associated beta strand repeat-containing protein [Kiritimatiellia bacterium]